MATTPEIVMVARNDTIADLVRQCAAGTLPFIGPDSLYSRVREMGFNGNGLYEAVIAEERAMKAEGLDETEGQGRRAESP